LVKLNEIIKIKHFIEHIVSPLKLTGNYNDPSAVFETVELEFT
jgi:hypothetical protein